MFGKKSPVERWHIAFKQEIRMVRLDFNGRLDKTFSVAHAAATRNHQGESDNLPMEPAIDTLGGPDRILADLARVIVFAVTMPPGAAPEFDRLQQDVHYATDEITLSLAAVTASQADRNLTSGAILKRPTEMIAHIDAVRSRFDEHAKAFASSATAVPALASDEPPAAWRARVLQVIGGHSEMLSGLARMVVYCSLMHTSKDKSGRGVHEAMKRIVDVFTENLAAVRVPLSEFE